MVTSGILKVVYRQNNNFEDIFKGLLAVYLPMYHAEDLKPFWHVIAEFILQKTANQYLLAVPKYHFKK